MNPFQPEMAATPLALEQFSEWPAGSDDEPFPEIAEERPFDRQRVADSITEGYGA